jgi:hypothetical protein
MLCRHRPPDPRMGAAIATFEARGSPQPCSFSAIRHPPSTAPPAAHHEAGGGRSACRLRTPRGCNRGVWGRGGRSGKQQGGMSQTACCPTATSQLCSIVAQVEESWPTAIDLWCTLGRRCSWRCGWEREPCGGPLHSSQPASWYGCFQFHYSPHYLRFLDTSNSNAQSLRALQMSH